MAEDNTAREPGSRLGAEHVCKHLDARLVRYELLEHPAAFTALGEALAAGVDPHAAAKTLVLRDRGASYLVVVPALRRLDLARARNVLDAGVHLRLATEAEMADDFPLYEVGALPLAGPQLPDVEVVDIRLLYRDQIVCAAGDHRHSVRLDPRELLRIVRPRVADVCIHVHSGERKSFGDLPHL